MCGALGLGFEVRRARGIDTRDGVMRAHRIAPGAVGIAATHWTQRHGGFDAECYLPGAFVCLCVRVQGDDGWPRG